TCRRGGRVVEGEEPPDVGHTVLLGRHGHPVGQGEHLAGDLDGERVLVSRFAGLDEPGVFGEPAGVEYEGHPVAVAYRPYRTEILQGYRLAATAVVGHRHHHQRDPLDTDFGKCGLESIDVHVPFEWMARLRITTFRNHQISCLRTLILDVRPCRVEMGVGWDDVARFDHG